MTQKFKITRIWGWDWVCKGHLRILPSAFGVKWNVKSPGSCCDERPLHPQILWKPPNIGWKTGSPDGMR